MRDVEDTPSSIESAPQKHRFKLRTKIALTVYGIVILSIVSSCVALGLAWHLQTAMQAIVRDNVESLRAAEELEISLLEQRGIISSYMLDSGNPAWLEELNAKEPGFRTWLDQARQTVQTTEQQEILADLESVFEQYVSTRSSAIDRFNAGSTAQARRILLTDVRALYVEAYELCEEFIAANDRYIASATTEARDKISWFTWLVLLGSLVTMGGGIAVLGLFHFGVQVPLQRMLAEAHGIHGAHPVKSTPGDDELKVIGLHMRNLMSDVTQTRSQLQTSQDRLLQSEKLASVGKLAASVAHEIRNPLTSMKMWLYSLRKSLVGDPELSRSVQLVCDETVRLEAVLRNFLAFSRPPELKLQEVSLSKLIDKTFELLDERLRCDDIVVERLDETALPEVIADADQLKQVFLNLANNSLEAMRGRGRITVSSNVVRQDGSPPMAVIYLADTGPGMPADAHTRIFEPFFTTKETGTGLGLCIAASVMARHGGRIALESTSPQGTTFSVWIPVGPKAEI